MIGDGGEPDVNALACQIAAFSVGLRLIILGQRQQVLSLVLFRVARRTGSISSKVALMPTACKYVATTSASWGISGLASWVNDQILTGRVPGG